MNHNKENVSVYDYVYHAKNYYSYKMSVVKQIDIKIELTISITT